MQAIVYHTYGTPDVLRLEKVETPTPAADEVLVRVHAASVNAADEHLLRGASLLVRMMAGGLNAPKKKILGADIAGVVEAVGSAVTKFKPGDAVYGDVSAARSGGFAEYAAVPEKFLALKPVNLSFEEAAAVPIAGMTALQGLRDKGQLQAGQKVLITGASGGVGSFAVQIAKAFGAEVTATCSTGKMEMVRALGADHVIDYTREDVTKGGQRYDVILDVAAYRPFSDYRPVMSATGRYVLLGGAVSRILRALVTAPLASRRGGQMFVTHTQNPDQATLVTLKEMIEAGKLKPVIDRCYPLTETPDAVRYLESRSVRGKIVIVVAGNDGMRAQ
jgi:NADPH:quinone reductase-like Zn-dependent oxidoreductase